MNGIRKYVDLALSVLLVTTVILGYYKDVSYMGEYCFISGLLAGVTLFLSFLRQQVRGKPLHECIYLACVVDLFVIFIATVAIRLSLEGAFWFIHIINPILMVMYWFGFCGRGMMRKREMLSVVAFPAVYMLFAFVGLQMTGSCPFPASLIFMDYSGGVVVAILAGLVVVLWALGFLLCWISKFAKNALAK